MTIVVPKLGAWGKHGTVMCSTCFFCWNSCEKQLEHVLFIAPNDGIPSTKSSRALLYFPPNPTIGLKSSTYIVFQPTHPKKKTHTCIYNEPEMTAFVLLKPPWLRR